MFAPIYSVVSGDAACQALLGGSPDTRIFPFGEADEGTLYPYAVWQVVSGSPENYLAGLPDADGVTLQVDIYASTSASAYAVAKALRNVIEKSAYIVRWGPQPRDPQTKSYRISFDVDWLIPR
ncbi:DUF3168 domain-containing protein [Pseudomonas aeruginosa]|uniref:DUF3168 domain-containing protein n=1 Tax=Pseudomonas aeruginosa TaxID=287 RepID=UPI00101B1B31|nr:DUF3168 domain-containing protein [Pseudomonas aeruginosa]QBC07944.1 DUF3168 domain-containing protein [Pseudomonas aeruginosa]